MVHSDSDLILHNSSVLIDKEPKHKKGTFQIVESARKVRIKVTALSIASPSTILVTRELER
ncbi:hypothetical protein [Enterococcus faecium]|uniref:hypothetical protein n=1 Tax=Enterococcus faecium TaxID=1352 RepID=UPI0009ADDA43|nr:hypothetical protein [Enterococcus faecium]